MHPVKGGGQEASRRQFWRSADAVPVCCALLAVGVGAADLIIWASEQPILQSMVFAAVLHPGTAVGVVLCGLSLLLTASGLPRAGVAAAALVVAATGGILIDSVFAGTASRLFGALDAAGRPRASGVRTLVAMLLLALSLALANARLQRAIVVGQLLAVWSALLGLFILIAYGFGLLPASASTGSASTLLTTAFGFIATSGGVLVLTRRGGCAPLLRDRGPGGTMFRLALPATVAIPLVVALMRIAAVEHGWIGSDIGVWLQTLLNTLVISTVVSFGALVLHRSDLERRQSERALRESERFNRLVAAANPDCIGMLDDNYRVLFVNEAVLALHGVTDESELIGKPFGYRLAPETQAERDVALRAAATTGSGRFTMYYPAPDGTERWFDTMISSLPAEQGSAFRYLAIARDVTEKRGIEDRIRWKATHDDLTGLPNRAHFQMHLDRHVRNVGQEGFALLTLDVDNFKMVNDTLGHDAGDFLLRTVAERISRAMRHGDIVARLAGDEFAVIARDVRTEAGAAAVAERIFENLREPWLYKGRLGECRMSIGASLAPRHGDTAEELFKHADIALYEAKSRGKAQIAIFRPSMKSAVERRNRQISLARHALASDFVVPYYQPKVNLASGRVAGFEALLRWRHPSQGVQLPSTIEAAFEDLELASEITQRMLAQILRDMSRWRNRGIDFGHVAINVTAADLRHNDFAERLLERLTDEGLSPACLQVEITESVFMGRGAEYVERALRQLHDAGIRIALDDFGTGYASLSHLKQFPVDIVKIDRSFLHDFSLDPQNQAIINTVISLGHSLDIAIVAEGIETREQERHLLARGCTFGQGFLYGKAVPALRVPRLLSTSRRELRKAA
jgi:diguanylate cyclase (GGDEF)-like protein/PAS domain S-box-containing protein